MGRGASGGCRRASPHHLRRCHASVARGTGRDELAGRIVAQDDAVAPPDRVIALDFDRFPERRGASESASSPISDCRATRAAWPGWRAVRSSRTTPRHRNTRTRRPHGRRSSISRAAQTARKSATAWPGSNTSRETDPAAAAALDRTLNGGNGGQAVAGRRNTGRICYSCMRIRAPEADMPPRPNTPGHHVHAPHRRSRAGRVRQRGAARGRRVRARESSSESSTKGRPTPSSAGRRPRVPTAGRCRRAVGGRTGAHARAALHPRADLEGGSSRGEATTAPPRRSTSSRSRPRRPDQLPPDLRRELERARAMVERYARQYSRISWSTGCSAPAPPVRDSGSRSTSCSAGRRSISSSRKRSTSRSFRRSSSTSAARSRGWTRSRRRRRRSAPSSSSARRRRGVQALRRGRSAAAAPGAVGDAGQPGLERLLPLEERRAGAGEHRALPEDDGSARRGSARAGDEPLAFGPVLAAAARRADSAALRARQHPPHLPPAADRSARLRLSRRQRHADAGRRARRGYSTTRSSTRPGTAATGRA